MFMLLKPYLKLGVFLYKFAFSLNNTTQLVMDGKEIYKRKIDNVSELTIQWE